MQLVVQASRAEQPHRADVAWIFVGFFLFVAILAMAALSKWIWRGGLGRTFER